MEKIKDPVSVIVADITTSKLSPDNLLEGFAASAVFVPQLSIMHIVDFNEI